MNFQDCIAILAERRAYVSTTTREERLAHAHLAAPEALLQDDLMVEGVSTQFTTPDSSNSCNELVHEKLIELLNNFLRLQALRVQVDE
jgi:hypothetical protein